jgi:hypothetical protein
VNFTSLKTRVAEETGLDTTDDDTKLGVWVNEAYRFISGLRQWPWLLKAGVVQTVTDITTGTVTISAGATTGTFSSAPSVSVANDYFIQFTTQSDDWYPITAHTASQTNFTIGNAFVGSTSYTAGTYICRKIYYSLASDVDTSQIVDMRQAITDNRLTYIDPPTFDGVLPDPTTTASAPYAYTILGVDSSFYPRAYFYPVATQKLNVHYRYFQKITDLSSGSDIPNLPEKWHTAIVFIALAMLGHPYIDDTRADSARIRAKALIDEMVRQVSPIPDRFNVIQPWDTRRPRRVFGVRFPDTFGYPWGR